MERALRAQRWVALVAVVVGGAGCIGRGPVGEHSEALSACAPATATWTVGHLYAAGERVLFGGRSYQCLQPHTAQAGWEPTKVPSLWALPTPCDVGPWAAQTLYVVGSRVTFGGATYACRQAHESLVGWEPPQTPALWTTATSGD